MRLLLIFALLAASVAFGPPSRAQASHDMDAHHAHAAPVDHHAGGGDGDDGAGKTHALAHVCPGCAFLRQPAVVEPSTIAAPLPRLPADPPFLRSANANPIPPPPRLD